MWKKMATRMIATEMWQDNVIRKQIKDITTRYMWLYLLTCTMSKTCGIFQLPLDFVALETKLSEEKVSYCIQELIKADLCFYSNETEEIVIYNYPKYNVRNLGKPMVDCLNIELSKIKDRSLVDKMVAKLEKIKDSCVEEQKHCLFENLIILYSGYGKETIIKEDKVNTNNNIHINIKSDTINDTVNDTEINDLISGIEEQKRNKRK